MVREAEMSFQKRKSSDARGGPKRRRRDLSKNILSHPIKTYRWLRHMEV
jgi:hypothetical protein